MGLFSNRCKPLKFACSDLFKSFMDMVSLLILFHIWQALYVKCPELNDLNLNSCTNLHPGIMFFPSSGCQIVKAVIIIVKSFEYFPERLLLQCPNLKNVHAFGCQDMLIGAIRSQVLLC